MARDGANLPTLVSATNTSALNVLVGPAEFSESG
jgi:hypothetical protein